ncbi:hypothetical protein HOK51_03835 [Candidatus Woesearchaeota archaeon]|jgi:hypothetical protein|nr:hypothetical protein [Candidatus Woesearchaeota archaeon]MBT6518953.1 hypothetical protein [Candidatus Woesearchaeota archaeon]MBT7368318.1 hypothetical protein [Candidatus Woesearchaeota archaeon]
MAKKRKPYTSKIRQPYVSRATDKDEIIDVTCEHKVLSVDVVAEQYRKPIEQIAEKESGVAIEPVESSLDYKVSDHETKYNADGWFLEGDDDDRKHAAMKREDTDDFLDLDFTEEPEPTHKLSLKKSIINAWYRLRKQYDKLED